MTLEQRLTLAEAKARAQAPAVAGDNPLDFSRYAGHPLAFARDFWPSVRFYDRQQDIVLSVRDCPETVVVAAHQLGKDYVAGFISLWAFLCHGEARVVTTSVKDDHLRVLWGEIGRFVQTAARPLRREDGGPLVTNHRDYRKLLPDGEVCQISYLRGMVSERGEGLAGHHAQATLLVIDEASGVDDVAYERGGTWAKRRLIFGNPYDCQNFFRKAEAAGDVPRPGGGYYRRLIRITAEDSPAVRRERARQRGEPEQTWPVEVPGVVTWAEYEQRRATWDKIRQTVGLDARFYEGRENLLFPPDWLDNSHRLAAALVGRTRRAKAIGVDPAEGGDKTAWAVVDEYGLIDLISQATADTAVITGRTLALMRQHEVEPENVVFDRGGGGKEHADRLRSQGFDVRTVAFGGTVTPEPSPLPATLGGRVDARERAFAYRNRRAQLFHELRLLLDPAGPGRRFAIPAQFVELRRQLAPMPLLYDEEGRIRMLPKSKRGEGTKEKTLTELLGRSPDDADALVLAVFGMLHPPPVVEAQIF